MRLVIAACFVLLAPTFAATIAGAQAAPKAASDINACTLLTATEISTIVGFPVTAGRRQDDGKQPDGSYSSACIWMMDARKQPVDPSAPARGRRFVILNAMQWPQGRDMAKTFLQAFHSAAAKGEIAMKPAPRNFGDEALWWGDGLAVRKGDVSFGVSVFAPKVGAARTSALEERLAPIVLKRLNERALKSAV